MNLSHISAMAEHNRQNMADVSNAIDVYRELANMLNNADDPFAKPPRWLTPAVLESMGKAAAALSESAMLYASDLEERLQEVSQKKAS